MVVIQSKNERKSLVVWPSQLRQVGTLKFYSEVGTGPTKFGMVGNPRPHWCFAQYKRILCISSNFLALFCTGDYGFAFVPYLVTPIQWAYQWFLGPPHVLHESGQLLISKVILWVAEDGHGTKNKGVDYTSTNFSTDTFIESHNDDDLLASLLKWGDDK